MVETSPSAESREIPKTVLDYLRNKRLTILNDYRTPDGCYAEHCGLIAINIAKLLLEAGRKPYIAAVSEDVCKNGFIYTKELVPTIYDGRIIWGGHQVCCCDGQAFDPMLEAPVPIDEYTKTVFGEDIKMEVYMSQEQIK